VFLIGSSSGVLIDGDPGKDASGEAKNLHSVIALILRTAELIILVS